MKSELYFRLGEMKGFTANEVAEKRQGWATPIRELLQNSLDASDTKNCKIDICIKSIVTANIPHIEEYKETLEKAITTQKQINSYNDNAERQVRAMEKALKEKELRVLMFVDNGCGMPPKELNGLLDERSVNKGAKSAGSFGVGHLSSYSLSSLRYVLYATKYKDEYGEVQNRFTGSPILAGHTNGDAQRSGKGRIVKCKPENEANPDFEFPDQFPNFIQNRMDKIQETGSLIGIVGLSDEWNEDAEYAIVSNYFHAIAHDSLSITVHRDGQEQTISAKRVEQLIISHKNEKNKKRENILSGKAVFQAWQTISEENTQETITLNNSEKVTVCIKTDQDYVSTIVLVRNGMVVARHDSMLSYNMNDLRNNSDFEQFTAVIDVEDSKAKMLFELVKGAESRHHNSLEKGHLSKGEEKLLKKLLAELSEKIKKYLTPITRESFDLPLFQTSSESATAQAVSGMAQGQAPNATPQPGTKPSPRPHHPPRLGPNPYPRPAPTVATRTLQSKNAFRYTDEGTKWKVHWKVVPEQYAQQDEVYLSMYLGEDHDKGAVETSLDIEKVLLDGKSVSIDSIPARQVKLGRLKPEAECAIVAEVNKPDKIGDMRVSLVPILGLKQGKADTPATKPSE